jgi:hypothetical protein
VAAIAQQLLVVHARGRINLGKKINYSASQMRIQCFCVAANKNPLCFHSGFLILLTNL